MSIAILLCIGAGFGFTLWILARKVDGIPQRLWTLAKDERARDDGRAQTVLQEAAAARIGPMVVGLRAYHDQLAAVAREQIAAAEMRARIAERRSSDAGVALGAASELVRDLRALLEESTARAAAPPAPRAATIEASAGPDQRPTVELSRSGAQAPVDAAAVETARMPAPASRERRSPRAGAQGIAPPGSAPQLSPAPAMVAAGLGPRPGARLLLSSTTPHAPPTRIGTARKETMIGLAPSPTSTGDDAERFSDDDVTRVGSRWSGGEATLPSMPAVALPGEREGGAS